MGKARDESHIQDSVKMTISLSAYDTTVGRKFNLEPIKKGLEKALVSNYLSVGESGLSFVTAQISTNPVEIPMFTHPVYLAKSPYDGLFVDQRAYTSYSLESGSFRITSSANYHFNRLRGGIELMWRNEPPTVLRSMGMYAMSVFSNWVAEGIAKHFTISSENQYELTMLAAWYYCSLFSNDTKPSQGEYTKLVQMIAQATRADASHVFEVIAEMDYFSGLDAFIQEAQARIGYAIEKLSVKSLITLLGSSYWGSDNMEVVAVGLEHIPTLYSLIYITSIEKSYRRSRLSQVMDHVPAKGAQEQFTKQLAAMVAQRLHER